MVTLALMCKNERAVIQDCLASVRPWIDYWVVVDTGSTDGTQGLVQEALSSIPGELHERPWVDFAHNRNQLLELAEPRGDYLLLMDADDVLHPEQSFAWPDMEADLYWSELRLGDVAYRRPLLIRSGCGWHYRGVVHEYLHSDTAAAPIREDLTGLRVEARTVGARSQDPLKYLQDAVLLEGALLREPEDARSMFYLAQSYRDAGQLDNAIDRYLQRADMGGWREEVFQSRYQAAVLQGRRGDPWPQVLEAMLKAWAVAPERAEPLYHITFHYRQSKSWTLALHFGRWAMDIPEPRGEALFVERDIYRWRIPDEVSVAAYWAGFPDETLALTERLLAGNDLPAAERPRVEANRDLCIAAPGGVG